MEKRIFFIKIVKELLLFIIIIYLLLLFLFK